MFPAVQLMIKQLTVNDRFAQITGIMLFLLQVLVFEKAGVTQAQTRDFDHGPGFLGMAVGGMINQKYHKIFDLLFI